MTEEFDIVVGEFLEAGVSFDLWVGVGCVFDLLAVARRGRWSGVCAGGGCFCFLGGGVLPSDLRGSVCWVRSSKAKMGGLLLESMVGEAYAPEGGEDAMRRRHGCGIEAEGTRGEERMWSLKQKSDQLTK